MSHRSRRCQRASASTAWISRRRSSCAVSPLLPALGRGGERSKLAPKLAMLLASRLQTLHQHFNNAKGEFRLLTQQRPEVLLLDLQRQDLAGGNTTGGAWAVGEQGHLADDVS